MSDDIRARVFYHDRTNTDTINEWIKYNEHTIILVGSTSNPYHKNPNLNETTLYYKEKQC